MTIPDSEPRGKDDAGTTEGTFLPLGDGDIYVCQDGPRDAPALLLIHGSASSAHSWDPLVPMLAESHRVIRIDLLGHGRSSKPDDGGYEIPDQGRRAGEALDRLGVEHAVVVGHSTGGSVATALTEQRPELVTALALVNSGPAPDAFIAQEFAVTAAQWPRLTDEQIRQVMSTAVSRPGYRLPQQLLDDARGMTYRVLTAAMRGALDYLRQQALPDRLAALGKPLLVLFGEDDRRWRPSSAAGYRAVPGAQVEMLPGVGHSPMLEDPLRTAALLLAFTAVHATVAAKHPNVHGRP